jgi:hypothetical protein
MAKQFLLVFAYLVAMGMAIESLGGQAELPSLELSRHFPAGGYESLKIQCHGDRTREEALICDLKRLRNGMEVSSVVIEYGWTKEQLGKFFSRIAKLSEPSTGSGNHLILSYDAQSDGRRVYGKIRRGEGIVDAAHAKAVLALEGSLVARFYQ